MELKLYRGSWAAVWYEGGRTKRRSLRTRDRAIAEQRLADLTHRDEGDMVGEAVESYLREKKGRARSHEAMGYAWAALKPMFAHLRPDQVTRDLCRQYAGQRRSQGRADGTIIKELNLLRTAIRFAGKAGVAQFDMPHAPEPRERHLTRSEYARLLRGARLPHARLFIILALATGARSSALLDLTWDRIDFERGLVRLYAGEGRRKGRATVPMTRRARRWLEKARKAAETKFVIEWAGDRVRSIKRSFREAARRAGLPCVTPHVLRHTAAVWMAEAGITMEEIAQFLGHSDPRVTYRVYARFSSDYLRRAASALE